jgi:general secretion pathway protein B
MSLILEALRKSEAERRRAQAPDLRAELPPAPAQRRVAMPMWAWLLPASAVLLAAAWWLRTPDQAGPATTDSDAGMSAHRETTPTLPVVPRLSPPAAVVAPKPATAVAQTSTSTQAAPLPAVAQAAVVAAAKPIPVPVEPLPLPPVATPPADANDGDILQLSDLSAAERKSLPPLKVSMHMWDGNAARRFVIVDGNRLVEGDRIGDAVVTTITTDGVLLDWNGRRLKLPIR